MVVASYVHGTRQDSTKWLVEAHSGDRAGSLVRGDIYPTLPRYSELCLHGQSDEYDQR